MPTWVRRRRLLPNIRGVYGFGSTTRSRSGRADREAAVRIHPDLPEVWMARGGSYHQLGRHEDGLKDRSEAIRLDPTMPEAWFARGSAYFLLKDYEKARADLAKALELRPDYPD